MDYKFYTPEEVKQILLRRNYHNTTVYKAVCKSAGIKLRDVKEDYETAKQREQEAEKHLLSNQFALCDLTKSINNRVVIRLVQNYNQLHQHSKTIDDFILIDSEISKLSEHDRLLLLGYYLYNYSFSELEKLAKTKGLHVTRKHISEQVNNIVDGITNNIMQGVNE